MRVIAATTLLTLLAAPLALAANTRRLGAADVSDIDNQSLSMDLIESAADVSDIDNQFIGLILELLAKNSIKQQAGDVEPANHAATIAGIVDAIKEFMFEYKYDTPAAVEPDYYYYEGGKPTAKSGKSPTAKSEKSPTAKSEKSPTAKSDSDSDGGAKSGKSKSDKSPDFTICMFPCINFDDITGFAPLINAGYAGLNWINMLTLDSLSRPCQSQEQGYITGNVSPSRVAVNVGPATVWSTSPFSVKSFYGTAAWYENLVLLVTGYQGSTDGLGGNLVGTYTVTLPAPSSGAQFHDLDASNSNVSGNFNNIDRLTIATSGGTTVNACGNPGSDQLAIDDLNVIF